MRVFVRDGGLEMVFVVGLLVWFIAGVRFYF